MAKRIARSSAVYNYRTVVWKTRSKRFSGTFGGDHRCSDSFLRFQTVCEGFLVYCLFFFPRRRILCNKLQTELFVCFSSIIMVICQRTGYFQILTNISSNRSKTSPVTIVICQGTTYLHTRLKHLIKTF